MSWMGCTWGQHLVPVQCPRLSLTSNPNFGIKFKFVQGHGVDGLHKFEFDSEIRV